MYALYFLFSNVFVISCNSFWDSRSWEESFFFLLILDDELLITPKVESEGVYNFVGQIFYSREFIVPAP
jgi:hypothetical protein